MSSSMLLPEVSRCQYLSTSLPGSWHIASPWTWANAENNTKRRKNRLRITPLPMTTRHTLHDSLLSPALQGRVPLLRPHGNASRVQALPCPPALDPKRREKRPRDCHLTTPCRATARKRSLADTPEQCVCSVWFGTDFSQIVTSSQEVNKLV